MQYQLLKIYSNDDPLVLHGAFLYAKTHFKIILDYTLVKYIIKKTFT